MPVYDPASGRLVNGNWVRDMFPGNRIPANRFDPVGKKLVDSLPGTEHHDGRIRSVAEQLLSRQQCHLVRLQQPRGRIDHNFGMQERIYGRYVWNNQLLHQNSNGLSGPAADLREGTKINQGIVLRFVDYPESNHNPGHDELRSRDGCRTISRRITARLMEL